MSKYFEQYTDLATRTMDSLEDFFNMHASGLVAMDVDDRSGDAGSASRQIYEETSRYLYDRLTIVVYIRSDGVHFL